MKAAVQQRHVDECVVQVAKSARIAQEVADSIRAGQATGDLAWLRLVEIVADHGWKSAATRSYVRELGKQAAACR